MLHLAIGVIATLAASGCGNAPRASSRDPAPSRPRSVRPDTPTEVDSWAGARMDAVAAPPADADTVEPELSR